MITTEQIQAAENDPETESLRQTHLRMRDSFVEVAKMWRKIAHEAQLKNDQDCVRMAHHYALENETWAKQAEQAASTL